VHVLRNALDHGVEAADRRRAAGKPDGDIRLAARTEADHVVIEVGDDGAGVDPARVREVAVHRGLLTQEAADALDDRTAVDLIFTPGFSTAAEVSAVSGRGVGMDVVRDAATRLGGKVASKAQRAGRDGALRPAGHHGADQGDDRDLRRRALWPGAGHGRGDDAGVGRSHRAGQGGPGLPAARSGRAAGQSGRLVGAARGEERAVERVIVARVQGELVGFAVDAIVDRMDAAVRPMSGLLAGAPGVMGTTLLSDGAVLMILDLAELIL
jgi:two-component system chemotaxis sensor kinase CheA